jgi:hypothetical protein
MGNGFAGFFFLLPLLRASPRSPAPQASAMSHGFPLVPFMDSWFPN